MTRESGPEFLARLQAFARGEIPASDLPLEDSEFWLFCVLSSARPGRASTRAPDVRIASERLLARPLAGKVLQARQAALLQALSRPDPRVRRVAIRQLRNAELGASAFEALSRAAVDRDADVRVTATAILARQESPRAIDFLLDLLENTNDVRATLASEALSRIGKPAVPGLVKLLDSGDEDIRIRATLCLLLMRDRDALRGLLKSFHDDSPSVAWAAADGLLDLGPEVASDVLKSVLNQPLGLVTIRALHHYAEHASPRGVFRPLYQASMGLGAGASTLVEVEEALKKLEGSP